MVTQPPESLFVDTGAFIAIVDRKDKHHDAARRFFEEAVKFRTRLITTNFVLSETLTWIRLRIGHAQAVAFWHGIAGHPLVFAHLVEDSLTSEAWEIFEQFSDQQFSFTDCTSFSLMRRLRFTSAFAFDLHFRAIGFVTLPLD